MPYLQEFLTLAVVHFLVLISPGPDFLLITRNSLIYSKKAGIYSALGISLGLLVHIAYSLLGLALIISQSILLFSIIKIIGAGYLIFIGYKSVTAKSKEKVTENKTESKDMSKLAALRMGLITNVTNPKVTLFFLSLFTVVISPSTPILIKMIYGLEMIFVTFVWFAIVASVFSHPLVKGKVSRIQHIAEKFMGAVLIALGIRLAFTSLK